MPKRVVAAWLCAAAALFVAVPVAQGGELERKRDDARRRQGEVRKQLDLAQATDAQMTKRLEEIDGDLARKRSEAGAAEADSEEAAAAVISIQADIDQLRQTLAHRRDVFNRRAVTAYMGGEGRPLGELNVAGELLALPKDFTEVARRAELVNRVSHQDGDVLAGLVQTQADLTLQEQSLVVNRAKAEQRAKDAAAAVKAVAALKREQEATQSALQQRITELQAEADALAAEQAKLEALIKEKLEAAARARAARGVRRPSFVGQRTGEGISAQGFIWPVRGTVTSGYGPRWGRMHTGIDIAAPAGTAIGAAKHGWVLYAGTFGGYGNLVAVDHGDNIVTLYAHQSKILVAEDQEVAQGQTLGLVGSTGHSTGNHLHFEVRIEGQPRDPRPYLP